MNNPLFIENFKLMINYFKEVEHESYRNPLAANNLVDCQPLLWICFQAALDEVLTV